MKSISPMAFYLVCATISWFLIGSVAVYAVFSNRIFDTVLERIGLAWVSIGSFAAAYNILQRGEISDVAMFVSLGFGVYASALIIKYRHKYFCDY